MNMQSIRFLSVLVRVSCMEQNRIAKAHMHETTDLVVCTSVQRSAVSMPALSCRNPDVVPLTSAR